MVRISAVWFCLASMACGAIPTPPKLRLPEVARPDRYRVDLHLTPGEERFSGVIEIDLAVLQPTSVIWLHGKSLTVQTASILAGGANRAAKAEPVGEDFIAITTERDVPRGEATLRIAYTGEVSRSLTDGVFQQNEGADWYIFTKFEPVTARRAFPCFDEPGYKTPWQLTLHVPEKMGAFSNAPVDAERAEANGMRMVRFRETKPLPSYLVAFATGPFDVVNTAPIGKQRVPGRLIVPHGRATEAEYAASVTPELIGMLERYYGVPYPYEKLDQIVVPLTTSWGAMENAGMIAYGDFLLSPKASDSALRQRRRAQTMLHEMAHQWFGDLVTMAWWDDLWLNEAFATWIERKLLDEAHPDWKIGVEEASASWAMETDSLTTARKIRQPIDAPGDIANAFDGITYTKGAAVIGMFENYAGAPAFQQAIRSYLGQHAWGNATSSDFLAELDRVAGRGIGPAFASFLNQVGFPLVHVALQCDGGRATVVASQERFVPLGSAGQADGTWQTPLCLRWSDAGGGHSQCTILAKARSPIALRGARGCPAWVFANENGAGYYAVAYDSALQAKLTANGITALAAAERASLLRDLELMFSAGKSDARSALLTAKALSNDPDRVIVEQTVGIVSSVSAMVPPDLQANYARFVDSLYGTRARDLGWIPKAGETEDTRELRLSLVPFAAEVSPNPSLRDEAGRLAQAWLKDHSSPDPDITPTALRTAAMSGDRAFFDALVAGVRASKVMRERNWMEGALASFRDPALEQAALDLMLHSDIDTRELTPVLFYPRRQTRDVAWKFAKENFDRLNAKLPGARAVPFGATVPFVAERYCDEPHRAEVEAFFKDRIQNLSGGKRNLDNVLETIRLCAARREAIQPALTAFLREQ